MPVNAMALTGPPAEVSFMWPFPARPESLGPSRPRPEPLGPAPRSYGKGARWVQTLAVAAGIAAMAIVAAAAQPGSVARPLKIVALGDSLTAGLGLPGEAAFPARLERAL